MAEEIIETEESKKKTDSRKFIVWLVWSLITAIALAIGIITMIITKSFPETVVDLIKLVLKYFFLISSIYLGVNFGQKVGFAISDAISSKESK